MFPRFVQAVVIFTGLCLPTSAVLADAINPGNIAVFQDNQPARAGWLSGSISSARP